MSESFVVAAALGLASFAAAFGLAEWVAVARAPGVGSGSPTPCYAGISRISKGDDMADATMADGVECLAAEREDARRWAVRLEGELAAAQERATEDLAREHARWRAADARAVDAEQQRDAVLGRLATSNGEMAAYRHQRDQARAERDEAVTALAALVAALDDDVTCDPTDERAARTVVARYRPAPATIESHGTPG